MKVLELFAGTRSISKVFNGRGHDTFTVELDERHPHIDHYGDVLALTPEYILSEFGRPDVIWASPPCTTYSIAGISSHRTKDSISGELMAVSDYAFISDDLVRHTLFLIDELKPKYWFIENPRGGLRKMSFMQDCPRHTVTYCQYGDTRMKPTDIWTNHPEPNFRPMCRNGEPCHESAPRGSKTGVQGQKTTMERSVIPRELCEHIALISEEVRVGVVDKRTTIPT